MKPECRGSSSNVPFGRRLVYIYEEGERKVGTRQSRAQIMQPEVLTISTGVDHARAVGLCQLSRNV